MFRQDCDMVLYLAKNTWLPAMAQAVTKAILVVTRQSRLPLCFLFVVCSMLDSKQSLSTSFVHETVVASRISHVLSVGATMCKLVSAFPRDFSEGGHCNTRNRPGCFGTHHAVAPGTNLRIEPARDKARNWLHCGA